MIVISAKNKNIIECKILHSKFQTVRNKGRNSQNFQSINLLEIKDKEKAKYDYLGTAVFDLYPFPPPPSELLTFSNHMAKEYFFSN